jgi:glycosyltransferase involved in cell wall biosynthesis
MARKISRVVNELGVDIVHVEHSFMARYVEAVPRESRAKTVLCFHNVGAAQYRRMLRMRLGPVGRAVGLAKWAIVVSEAERELLRRANPRLPVTVVENGVDTRALGPLPDSRREDTLLFVGTFTYPPNVDAARYFCRAVLPLVRREVPGARVVLVGHEPPPSVRALAGTEGVVVTGSVPDVTPYYAEATACVAPLRAGGGTRLKILEAMALGRVVVSTTFGAEGLDVVDGEHVLLADTPRRFADATVRLLRDAGLRRRLSENARARVVSQYDWSAIGDELVRTYGGLVEGEGL